MSVKIEYGGIAIGSKEGFDISAENISDISQPEILKQSDINILNFGNPCEMYSVVLDGQTMPIEDDEKIAIYSEAISGADGVLESPLTITLSSTEYFSSSGISFTFDTNKGIYCTELTIYWYRDEELIEQGDFSPTEAFFFCSQKVDLYNKVIIEMRKVNMPYNRIRVNGIEHGLRVTFDGRELRNTSVRHEMDLLSAKLPISTSDFVLDSKRNIEYSFQERQPVNIWFGDTLVLTSFIKSAVRKSANLWSIKSEDYIALLESTPFSGGIYEGKSAYDLAEQIFQTAKVMYDIDDSLKSESVTGHIGYTNCREALKQVAFASGAVVNTSYSEKIRVYPLAKDTVQEIPLERIMQGQSIDEKTRVTAVSLTAHSYKAISEQITAYEADKSGEGERIFVKFSEPLHNLSITNGSIEESGANYAIINASSGCVLVGQKYEHSAFTKTRNNPLVLSGTTDNVIEINNATLVSRLNIDKLLDLCYNYYETNNEAQMRIADRKHSQSSKKALYGDAVYGVAVYGGASNEVIEDVPTKIGDTIMFEMEYGEPRKGIIYKQTFSLNGGILIKDTKLREVE